MSNRSTLPSAILTLLAEEPMHPYGIQQVIRHRRKHEVINVSQRPALYQAIHRLEREGLIRAQSVARDDKRPERTIYELTDAGRETVDAWLRRGLSTPLKEYPEFPAVLSFLAHLSPDEARQELKKRVAALDAEDARHRHEYAQALQHNVPRVELVESEYLQAISRAERAWIASLIAQIEAGTLTWVPGDRAWIGRDYPLEY